MLEQLCENTKAVITQDFEHAREYPIERRTGSSFHEAQRLADCNHIESLTCKLGTLKLVLAQTFCKARGTWKCSSLRSVEN